MGEQLFVKQLFDVFSFSTFSSLKPRGQCALIGHLSAVSKDSLVTEGQTSRSEAGIPPLRTVGIRDPVDAISTTLRCVYPLSPPPPSPSLLTLKKRLHLCVTLGSTHVNFIIFCVLNVFIHFEKPLLLCIYAHISIFHCICFSLPFDSNHMHLN